MKFDSKVFGEGFHRFVQLEIDIFGIPLSIIFHITTLVLLYLIFRHGNKYRKIFTLCFAANWLFLFGYWGVYAIFYWAKIGIPYLASFILTPILLGSIAFHWIKEIFNPKFDLDFRNVKRYKFIVILILIWGFWYPTYVYGHSLCYFYRNSHCYFGMVT